MGVFRFGSIKTVFLVLLILIVLTSFVNAERTVLISGNQDVPGYRAVDDVTKINISSDYNVSISQGTNSYEMECSKVYQKTVCTHEFEQSTLEPKEYVLTFKETNNNDQIFTWSFAVDGVSPKIDLFNVIPVQDKLEISLDLVDIAFLNSQNCSGIKQIEITSEDESLFKEELKQTNICEYTKTFKVDAPIKSGNISFNLIVTDYVGNYSQKTYGPIEVDFKSPEIQDGVIVLSGEKEINVISSSPQIVPVANVHVKIKDDNLAQVFGDLHLLSRDPSLQDKDSNRIAYCILEGLIYDCVFEDVSINPGSTQVVVQITALDSKGLISKKNLTTNFQMQTSAGEITYFGRPEENCFEDSCYYKTGINTLKLDITSEVEIRPFLITISSSDLSSVSLMKPYSCNETTTNKYTCYSNFFVDQNIPLGKIGKIVLTTPTTDSLGTSLKGISSTKAIIDNEKPINTSSLKFSSTCPISGEKETFTINVTDSLSPKMYIRANVQNVTTKNYFEDECQRQGNVFVCSLELSTFVSYSETEKINIQVIDMAGNVIDNYYSLNVCEAESDITPETISSITSDSKQKIDKRILSFKDLATNVYLPLDIDFKSQNIEITDLDTDGCYNTDLLSGIPYFINEKSKNPVLVIPLSGKTDEEYVEINCTIKVYQKRGVVRYTIPESEILTLKVETYNQNLGSIDEATEDKLNETLNEIHRLQDDIAKWEAYNKIMGKMCSISDGLNKAFSALAGVESVLYSVALGTQQWGGGQWFTTLCNNFFTNVKLFRQKMWPVGSIAGDSQESKEKLQVGFDSFLKAGCMVYNCGLCSPQGALQTANVVYTGINQINDIGTSYRLDEQDAKYTEQLNKFKNLEESLDKLKLQLKGLEKDSTLYDSKQKEIDAKETEIDSIVKKEGLTKAQLRRDLEAYQKSTAGLTDEQKQELEDNGFTDIGGKSLDELIAENAKGISDAALKVSTIQSQLDGIEEQGELVKLNQGISILNFRIEKLTSQLSRSQEGSVEYGLTLKERSMLDSDKLNKQSRVEDLYDIEIESTTLGALNSDLEYNKGLFVDLQIQQEKLEDLDISAQDIDFQRRYIQEMLETDGGYITRLDPFENKGFAQSCLCAPGVKYAREKEIQLQCRMYKCIEENSAKGLPITNCEQDLSQGMCMYVDGPLSGLTFWEKFTSSLGKQFLYGEDPFWKESNGDAVWAGISQNVLIARKALCFEEYMPFGTGNWLQSKLAIKELSPMQCDLNVDGWRTTTCAISGSLLSGINFKSYFDKPWFEQPKTLPGEDYCEGVPLN